MSQKRRTTKSTSKPAVELLSNSVEETQAFGQRLGALLGPGDVVALRGELGSGKTTLIQGIAQGLGRDPETIKSPTFVLMREYPARPGSTKGRAGGEIPLIHIDGYRLEGAPAIAFLDTELIFAPTKITLIEWAERFGELLPEQHLQLELRHVSAKRRRIGCRASGDRAAALIARLEQTAPKEPAPAAVAEEDDGAAGD